MKAFAKYFWKAVTVTFVAVGLSVVFSSSASADEAGTDIAFLDQADPAYVECFLERGSAFGADTFSPEEESLREEAERAARDPALVGFEERLAFFIDMYMSHPEFDGGIKSVANGVMYFSTTEAGYEYYSKELKSMIDDGYIVMDATFDMRWPTEAESESAYWAAKSEESATVEQDGETINSEPISPTIVQERKVSYVAIESTESPQGGDSTVTWFAYGPSGTEKVIDWSRLYYQFALLSMLTLQQPGSSVGVISDLPDSGQ
jgi:hypothetical protein